MNKHVLEPRPESETMIDLLKASNLPAGSHIADVGAGSGALGITAKLELPNTYVDLVEIDTAAVTVARKNVNKFSVVVNCVKSDLLTQTTGNYVVILANLPYVPDNFHINQAAQAEPRLAIFGGGDWVGPFNISTVIPPAYTSSLAAKVHVSPNHCRRNTANWQKSPTRPGSNSCEPDDFIQRLEPASSPRA